MATTREVRRAIVQAQESEDGFGFFALEVTAAAIGSGYYWHSWYLGGGVFVGGIVLMLIPYVRVVFSLGLSVLWGLFGYALGIAFFTTPPAGYVIGGLAFFITLGLHLQAIQRGDDTDPSI
jgi:hypothetical protein